MVNKYDFMGKEEKLFNWEILLSATIIICCSIAVFTIVYLNINVSFVVELLVVNIDFVTIFISGSIVVVTVYYSITTKKNLNHQILVNLRKEYGSAEMMYALQRLWTFYRINCDKNIDKLRSHYIKRSEEQDENFMRPKTYEGRIRRIKNSLSYQRRLVSGFYYHLADLHLLEMIPDDILFSIWSNKDLEILDKIIIPLEEEQAELDGQYKVDEINYEIKKLKKLYDDSLTYRPTNKFFS